MPTLFWRNTLHATLIFEKHGRRRHVSDTLCAKAFIF